MNRNIPLPDTKHVNQKQDFSKETMPSKSYEMENYRSLVEGSPDVIFSLSLPHLTFTYLNSAFEKTTGLKINDWIEKKFTDLVYSEDYALAEKKIKESLSGRPAKNFWLRVRSEKKKFLVLEFQLVPKVVSGKIIAGIGVARDITRRKEWENDLKFQRSLLKAQSEASIDGILVITRDKEVILYNHHFMEMWQLNAKILSSRSEELVMKYLLPKLMRPKEFLSIIRQTYRSPQEKSHDEVKLKDGRVLNRYSAPLTGSDGSNFGRIWFFRDVTEQKEDERRKDDFVAIASHELKTPITSLKAFTQILTRRQEKTGDRSLEFFLSRMNSQINNLTELVTDLLDVTRLRTGKMELNCEYFNLGEFLKEAIDLSVSPENKQQIKLDITASPRIKADKHRIRQVLSNLLINAFKYSRGSPKVIVSTRNLEKEVIVSVKDFGIGIETSKLKKIFEPFSQYRKIDSENMPSLGLGLYISSEIIKKHSGRIWAESRPQKGSTFYFSLPKSKISR